MSGAAPPRSNSIPWPGGRRFAFTVFDDTEHASVENNRAIYGLLRDLGMRGTKSVWMFDGRLPELTAGATCADPVYLALMRELQRDGFEIGWHNATWSTSDREATLRGLDLFRDVFGHDPATMANHASNREGIYWGAARVGGWRARLYRCMNPQRFEGHEPDSPLFWGDLCAQRIRYVRNFTFGGINTLKACPLMPYHDMGRPHVRAWFASSDAGNVTQWNAVLNEAAIDRLEEEGGACIAYTHFGKGFHSHGELNRRFREVAGYLARKNAWFPTVAELLDHLAGQRPAHEISANELAAMETRWLADCLKERVGQRLRALAREGRARMLGQ